MQKYGILENGKLKIVSEGKPIVHADVPEFDQETQAVFEKEPMDMGDYIYIDVEVREVEPDDGEQEEML